MVACIKVLVSVVLYHLVPVLGTNEDYLFFSHPGDRSRLKTKSGFYGGPVSSNNNGSSSDLLWTGYNCANTKSIYELDELNVKAISFDPESQDALIQVDHGLTLYRARLCTPRQTCENETQGLELLFFNARFQEFGHFALFENEYYGLATIPDSKYNSKQESIELRKITDCQSSFPVSSSKTFDMETCTTRLATILISNFERFSPHRALSLHVVRAYGYVRFLVQIQEAVYAEGTLSFLNVMLLSVDEEGKVTDIHTSEVDGRYAAYIINHMGGMSYKDGTLCWTVFNRLLCGSWNGYRVSDVKTILAHGQAAHLCKSVGRQWSDVLSGVALARTDPDLELYFGCMADGDGRGGGGFLRKRRGSKTAGIFPLKTNNTNINVGSMFLTSACRYREQSFTSAARITSPHLTWLLTLPLVLSKRILSLLV